MNISEEDAYFVRVSHLFYKEISKQLRQFFKDKWNQKFMPDTWSDRNQSGKALWNKIVRQARKNMNKGVTDKIKAGNSNFWDCSVLFSVLLFADLGLIPPQRDETQQQQPLLESENIARLHKIRNQLAHNEDATLTLAEFESIFKEVSEVYGDLGWPLSPLDALKTGVLETEDFKRIKQQIQSERMKSMFIKQTLRILGIS